MQLQMIKVAGHVKLKSGSHLGYGWDQGNHKGFFKDGSKRSKNQKQKDAA